MSAKRRAAEDLSASQFLERGSVKHLNLMSVDAAPARLAASPLWRGVVSLDLSRLELDDQVLSILFEGVVAPRLRWLDLSGNAGVGIAGVEAICLAVRDRRLPSLAWLDLLGTAYDATPYLDGCYARMTEEALSLAQRYGTQRWMMIGSGAEGQAAAGRYLAPSDRATR